MYSQDEGFLNLYITSFSHKCYEWLTYQQEKLLGHLGVVLYEYLGEEYPEVLGSILGGLKVRFLTCCQICIHSDFCRR